MQEVNPVQIRARWYMTTYRNALDSSPEEEEASPTAYARRVSSENFQQEVRDGINGGGVYFAKSSGSFEGYGRIYPGTRPLTREEISFPGTYEYFSATRRRVHFYQYKLFRREGHDLYLLEDVEYHKPHEGVTYTFKREKRTVEQRKDGDFTQPWEIISDETEEQEFPISLSGIEFPDNNPNISERRIYYALLDDDPDAFREQELLVYEYNTYLMEDQDQESGIWYPSFDPEGAYETEMTITFNYVKEGFLDTCEPSDFNAGLG